MYLLDPKFDSEPCTIIANVSKGILEMRKWVAPASNDDYVVQGHEIYT
jgi:hypothetical protein